MPWCFCSRPGTGRFSRERVALSPKPGSPGSPAARPALHLHSPEAQTQFMLLVLIHIWALLWFSLTPLLLR